MKGKIFAAGLIAASLVIVTAGLAAGKPASPKVERTSVGCPEGGVTLSLVVWKGSTNDGSGNTFIRRLRIDNACAEYALVWFAVDQNAGPVSSLLVPPATWGTLDTGELDGLGWGAPAPAWRLWIDAETGATNDHYYCSFSSVVPAPGSELQGGTLASFSCL